MAGKRKRDLTDDVMELENDSVCIKKCLNTFGGDWNEQHWQALLMHPETTMKALGDMEKTLKAKSLSPYQVAAGLFDHIACATKLQD